MTFMGLKTQNYVLVKTGKYSPDNIQDCSIAPDGIIDSIGDIAKILDS